MKIEETDIKYLHVPYFTVQIIGDTPFAKRSELCQVIDYLSAHDVDVYEAYKYQVGGEGGVTWNEDTKNGFQLAIYALRDSMDNRIIKEMHKAGVVKRMEKEGGKW